MNIRIYQGVTMLVKPQNLKRLSAPPRRSLRLPMRDQALQLYTSYIGVSFLAYLQGFNCERADGSAGVL